jgi:Mevalonate 5-diphosphate decarboxylase C-terminal domain
MQVVHAYNRYHGRVRAAYTFDAGPNAVIYTLERDTVELLALLLSLYPPSPSMSAADYCSDPELFHAAAHAISSLPPALLAEASSTGREPHAGDVQSVYATRVGGGPKVLPPGVDCMLDPLTGLNCYTAPVPKAKPAAAAGTAISGTVTATAASTADAACAKGGKPGGSILSKIARLRGGGSSSATESSAVGADSSAVLEADAKKEPKEGGMWTRLAISAVLVTLAVAARRKRRLA